MSGLREKMDGYTKKIDEILHSKNAVNDALGQVESKTGVKRLYIVLALVALVALWLMIGYGAQFLCNFVGFLYPAYASVKAIETSKKEDDTQWLTYWVVYSAFALIEFFADIFLFWIPFYWFLKCCFLVWCMMPLTNGSQTIYHKIIKPFVLKHQKKVDQAIDDAAQALNEGFAALTQTLYAKSSDIAKDVSKDAVTDAAFEVLKKSS